MPEHFQREKAERQKADHFGQTNEIQEFYLSPEKDAETGEEVWVTTPPAPNNNNAKKRKHEGAAIQLYLQTKPGVQVESLNNSYSARQVRIQSPLIREVLADDFKEQGLMFNDKHHANSMGYHKALFFCRDKINQLSQTHEDPDTRSHCKLLHQIIRRYLEEALEAYDIYEREGTISYRFMWILFPVGKVFAVKNVWGSEGGFRVESVHQTEKAASWVWPIKYQQWRIRVEYVRWGGIYFGIDYGNFAVQAFAGMAKLCDVDPWFVDLSKDPKLRTKLVRRGENILKYQEPAYVQYASNVDPSTFAAPLTEGERLVVDTYIPLSGMRLFYKRLPAYEKYDTDVTLTNAMTAQAADAPTEEGAEGNTGASMAFARPTKNAMKRNEEAMLSNEDNLVLCAPTLVAYSVRRGYWAWVVIENLVKVKLERDSFDKLVYDEQKKNILKVLAGRFVLNRRPYDDLIPDKGNCFLVLLSGKPGTGKTLMAESLADHLNRPLLRVLANHKNPTQARDMGNERTWTGAMAKVAEAASQAAIAATLAGKETDMRTEFETKVQMAADWDGIVLIDEANFVVDDNSVDTSVGSSISVFLRYIEYFQGIVFLTTNAEPKTINAALRSRAHVHYHFSDLTQPMRAKVWRNFVERTPEVAQALDDEQINRLAQWGINGRDIKNIFNMARVWCEEQKTEMTSESIEMLIPAVDPLAVKEGSGRPQKHTLDTPPPQPAKPKPSILTQRYPKAGQKSDN